MPPNLVIPNDTQVEFAAIDIEKQKPAPTPSPTHFHLYRQRWIQLLLFSTLALLNNLVCYTFTSVHMAAKGYYNHTISLQITVSSFFIAYVIFSFPSSWFVEKYGLRTGVCTGAWLQCIGTIIRCIPVSWIGIKKDNGLEPIVYFAFTGQIVAALGQAFFVNPPPLLASTWFGDRERTLATTISVNANTLGIACAYLLGPALVHQVSDIPTYLQTIAILSLITALFTTFLFHDQPTTPPSHAAHSRSIEKHAMAPGLHRIKVLFMEPGFVYTVAAFAVAEATINGFSAFMTPLLAPLGYTLQFVGFMACTFIFACLAGSAVVGWIVDQTKFYKLWMLLSLAGAVVSVLVFYWAIESREAALTWLVILSVACVGFTVGPIQPLAIETAVECTHPTPESSVTAVQQVVGNIASAALFPVMLMFHDADGDMSRALVMLAAVLTLMALIYTTFHAPYRRLLMELEQHTLLTRANSETSLLLQSTNGYGSVDSPTVVQDDDGVVVPLSPKLVRQISDSRLIGISSSDYNDIPPESPTKPPLMSTNSLTFLAKALQEEQEATQKEEAKKRKQQDAVESTTFVGSTRTNPIISPRPLSPTKTTTVTTAAAATTPTNASSTSSTSSSSASAAASAVAATAMPTTDLTSAQSAAAEPVATNGHLIGNGNGNGNGHGHANGNGNTNGTQRNGRGKKKGKK